MDNITPLEKPVESATKPIQLNSDFYFGGSHLGETLNLITEPYGNLAGYTSFPLSFGFKNNPSYNKEGWEGLMSFSYSPIFYKGHNDHTWAIVKTSNRADAYDIADLLEYGMVDNPDNDSNRFKGWLEATEGTHAIEYVKPNMEEGLFEFPEHLINYSKFGMTDVRLPVRDLSGLVPINMVGNYISLIANAEQDFRNLIYKNPFTEGVGFNPATEAWLNFLVERGYGPAREIAAYGAENFERQGTAAGTYALDKAVLAASKNISEWAAEVAERYGLRGNEAINFIKNAAWQHELFHVVDRRVGRSKDETEAELGDLLAEFYDEMTGVGKPEHAGFYGAIKDFNRNYSEAYRSGRQSQESLLESKLEALIERYVSEADRLGLEGENAREYVASKLESEAKSVKSNDVGESRDAEYQGKGADGEKSAYEKSEMNSGEAQGESAESDGSSGEASVESGGSLE